MENVQPWRELIFPLHIQNQFSGLRITSIVLGCPVEER